MWIQGRVVAKIMKKRGTFMLLVAFLEGASKHLSAGVTLNPATGRDRAAGVARGPPTMRRTCAYVLCWARFFLGGGNSKTYVERSKINFITLNKI